MNDEVAILARSLGLEYIDKHNVDHRLNKNIRTIRTNVIDALHPASVIVILLYAELQTECIRERQFCARRFFLQLTHKMFQILNHFLIHLISIRTRKQVEFTHVQFILNRKITY